MNRRKQVLLAAILAVGALFLAAIRPATSQSPPPLPVVSFSVESSFVTEDVGTVTITVVLSEASSETVTVEYWSVVGTADSPSDFTAVSGTVTFDPNETSKT